MPSKLPRRSTSERLGQGPAGPAHHDDAMPPIADPLAENAVHVMMDSVEVGFWDSMMISPDPRGGNQSSPGTCTRLGSPGGGLQFFRCSSCTRCLLKAAIHARPSDPEFACNGRCTHPHCLQVAHALGINARRSTLVDGFHLRLRDTLELSLLAQVGLELSEHAEHVEEYLTCSGRRVDRLFGRLDVHALGFEVANEVLEVAEATRQAVNASDHQCVAGMAQGCQSADMLTSTRSGDELPFGRRASLAGGLPVLPMAQLDAGG